MGRKRKVDVPENPESTVNPNPIVAVQKGSANFYTRKPKQLVEGTLQWKVYNLLTWGYTEEQIADRLDIPFSKVRTVIQLALNETARKNEEMLGEWIQLAYAQTKNVISKMMEQLEESPKIERDDVEAFVKIMKFQGDIVGHGKQSAGPVINIYTPTIDRASPLYVEGLADYQKDFYGIEDIEDGEWRDLDNIVDGKRSD